ncbi:hypothetical protein DPMN_062603 [Dreissena polymorpha]|uniref:Uncharacterized protein n=1 Tax=Dreissena polymorpha TaxID=45954 RepID=A0A9D4HJF2_DREPO|nr:hypothetical protein DPMN_062603 [Dreissena polymorpha]
MRRHMMRHLIRVCAVCLKGFLTFKALNEYPSYMMLLGGACSPCTESTAEASHYYNITQDVNITTTWPRE